MGQGALDYQGVKSGIKLNDIIEDFKYVYKGQTIKAGDLVEYINGLAGEIDLGVSSDKIVQSASSSGFGIDNQRAVLLSDNRIFILTASTSSGYLGGVVLTVSDKDIITGTLTTIYSDAYGDNFCSVQALSNNRVLIAHSATSSFKLMVTLCRIEGNVISVISSATKNSNSNSGKGISTTLLPEGNVFISHSYGSSYYLYGMVCKVSNDTLTTGTDTSLNTTSNQSLYTEPYTLNDGRVFILHHYTYDYALLGTLVSISELTITKQVTQTIKSTASSDHESGQSGIVLPSGEILFHYAQKNVSGRNLGIIKVDGTSITLRFSLSVSWWQSCIGFVLLPTGQVALVYGYADVAGRILTITNSTIIFGTEVIFATGSSADYNYLGRGIVCLLLDNGTIPVFHPSNNDTNNQMMGQVWGVDYVNNIFTNHIKILEYEQQVTPAIQSPFDAIALSSGEGGTDTEHKDQVKIGKIIRENLFPNSWILDTQLKAHSEDGFIIETDGMHENTKGNIWSTWQTLEHAFDGDVSARWISESKSGASWLKIICPYPVLISKMKIRAGATTGHLTSAIIQGSKDGNNWIDLYTITENQSALTEIILSNTDYYTQYRAYITITSAGGYSYIYEWEATEYIIGGDV